MKIIVKTPVTYICGECGHGMYYINNTNGRIAGKDQDIVKCINYECRNKGKVVEIPLNIIEVEPKCVQHEAGKVL